MSMLGRPWRREYREGGKEELEAQKRGCSHIHDDPGGEREGKILHEERETHPIIKNVYMQKRKWEREEWLPKVECAYSQQPRGTISPPQNNYLSVALTRIALKSIPNPVLTDSQSSWQRDPLPRPAEVSFEDCGGCPAILRDEVLESLLVSVQGVYVCLVGWGGGEGQESGNVVDREPVEKNNACK
jgi:hypothetical protein